MLQTFYDYGFPEAKKIFGFRVLALLWDFEEKREAKDSLSDIRMFLCARCSCGFCHGKGRPRVRETGSDKAEGADKAGKKSGSGLYKGAKDVDEDYVEESDEGESGGCTLYLGFAVSGELGVWIECYDCERKIFSVLKTRKQFDERVAVFLAEEGIPVDGRTRRSKKRDTTDALWSLFHVVHMRCPLDTDDWMVDSEHCVKVWDSEPVPKRNQMVDYVEYVKLQLEQCADVKRRTRGRQKNNNKGMRGPRKRQRETNNEDHMDSDEFVEYEESGETSETSVVRRQGDNTQTTCETPLAKRRKRYDVDGGVREYRAIVNVMIEDAKRKHGDLLQVIKELEQHGLLEDNFFSNF